MTSRPLVQKASSLAAEGRHGHCATGVVTGRFTTKNSTGVDTILYTDVYAKGSGRLEGSRVTGDRDEVGYVGVELADRIVRLVL